jgi:hypothetical protein
MTRHRSRPRRLQLTAALLAGLALAAAGAALAAGGGKGAKTAWPQHVQLTEARLAVASFQGDFQLPLPQFRAYDAQGRQLYASSGYEPAGFKEIMTWLLTTPEKRPALGKSPDPDVPRTLAADLARLEAPDGKALPKPPAAHPGVKVSLIHVDADLMKRSSQKKAG